MKQPIIKLMKKKVELKIIEEYNMYISSGQITRVRMAATTLEY